MDMLLSRLRNGPRSLGIPAWTWNATSLGNLVHLSAVAPQTGEPGGSTVVLAGIEDLARTLTEDEVAPFRGAAAARAEALADRMAPWRQMDAWLNGRPVDAASMTADQVRATTRQEIAAAADQLRASALLTTPEPSARPKAMRWDDDSSAPSAGVGARVFRSAAEPTLVVTMAGTVLRVTIADRGVFGADLSQAALVTCSSSGEYVIFAETGTVITLRSANLLDRDELRRLIAASVPPERFRLAPADQLESESTRP
jgi:hypothetical protein